MRRTESNRNFPRDLISLVGECQREGRLETRLTRRARPDDYSGQGVNDVGEVAGC